MKDYDSCYKSYDIRSIYKEPLDASFVFSLGQGLGNHLIDTIGKDAKVVFGCDVREANNELVYRFIKGLESKGITQYVGLGQMVENIGGQSQKRGVCSTPYIYHMTKDDFDVGIIFTASHNPPEYVGMKIADKGAFLFPSHELKDLVGGNYSPVGDLDQDDFLRIWEYAMSSDNPLRSNIEHKNNALESLLLDKYSRLEKKAKVVVDFTNGGAIAYEKSILQALQQKGKIECIFMNDLADSTFSAHSSDTSNPSDYQQLMDAVVEYKADLGVMFDGDGDRLGFVDEKGQYLGDIIIAVIVKNMLSHAEPGSHIVYDITCTNAIPDIIQEMGGVAIPCRVGYRYIKEKVNQYDGIFGGELSGHLLFPEVGNIEFPLLALYHVLHEMQQYDSCSELIHEVTKYYKPPLVNYQVTDKNACLAAIKDAYSEYDQDFTDGIRVNLEDGWFLVRPSNTEPKMRMYCEASSKEKCEKIIDTLKQYLV